MRTIAIIKWGNSYCDSYTYGSEVIFSRSRAYFSSPMMPVGAKIKTWNSLGSYSENRISPLLPLLTGKKTYRLTMHLNENAKNGLQIILVFYDRFHNEIEKKYSNDMSFDFYYPEDAVSYQIHLVNKHHEAIIFYFMMLAEVSDEEVYEVSVTKDLSSLKWSDPDEDKEDKLVVVIDWLTRETTVSEVRKNELHFFVSEEEDSLLNLLVEISGYLKSGLSAVDIRRGKNFERLPAFYQFLPQVLKRLHPDSEITSDIPFQIDNQNESPLLNNV